MFSTPEAQTARCLIITGMHRSGTSLTAALLQSAGLHIGEELMVASPWNLKGHFENIEFYRFHQTVLQFQGIHADGWTLQDRIDVEEPYITAAKQLVATNAMTPAWGWKDPRTTLFLEFWANLLPDSNFLLVYRSPWEVIDSLYRRSTDEILQKQPELAVKIWSRYNRKILEFCKRYSERCLLVGLPTLVRSPSAVIEAINQRWNFNLVTPAPEIYEPALLKTQQDENNRSSQIHHYFPDAIELYEALETSSWNPEGLDAQIEWRDRTIAPFHRLTAFRDWQMLRRLEQKNRELQSGLEQSQAQVQQLQMLKSDRVQAAEEQSELLQARQQFQQVQMDSQQAHALLQQKEDGIVLLQQQLQQSQTDSNQLQGDNQRLRETLEQTQTERQQLSVELEQTRSQSQQFQVELAQSQVELEQARLEVDQARSQSQQFQSELRYFQAELEQSQTELQQSRSQLQYSQFELQQTQSELEQTRSQLRETEAVLDRSQDQLHQTEAVLEQVYAQMQQSQSELQQSQSELQRSQEQNQQFQSELEQTRSEFQQHQIELQQTQSELEQTRSERSQSETLLHQQQEQLRQAEALLERSQAQLHETETVLSQFHTELQQVRQARQQAEDSLATMQAQFQSAETERLKLREQLQQVQMELERSQIRQSLQDNGNGKGEYDLLVWDAWMAYRLGNLEQMVQLLKQSLNCASFQRSEAVLKWIETFTQLAAEQGQAINFQDLVNSPEWQQLVRYLTKPKSLIGVTQFN